MFIFKRCKPLITRYIIINSRHAITKYSSTTCAAPGSSDPYTKLSLLPNGVRVATEYQDSPLAAITLVAEAGPRFETAANNGMFHFIEHLAYKGISGNCNIEETMQLMGANLTVNTTREMQTFTAKCFPECAPAVVSTLCGIITGLSVDASVIQAEKYNVCLEMVDSDNNPREVCFDYLHQSAFQGTPLANRVIGKSKNIEQFEQNTIYTFLSEFYQPYKLVLASSGRLDHEMMLTYADGCLGHLVGDPAFESCSGPNRYTGSQILYRNDSMPFVHLAIAFEAPGYMQPNYLPMYLAHCITGDYNKSQGGGYNHGSHLQRAAAHDMAEHVESFYIPYRDVGLWGVYVVTDKHNVEHIVPNIQDMWMKNCSMLNFFEVDRARQQAKLKLARNVDGVVKSAHDLGYQMMYTCTRKPINELIHLLSNIKVSEVQRVCAEYIYDRCPVVVGVGPTEAVPDYTNIRAGQYWLRF